MRTGVIAKKVGMTRLFQEDGRHVPVTVLALEGCQVTANRTADRDGYWSVQVGSGVAKQKNVNKPQREAFAKAEVGLKMKVAEFRVENEEGLLPVGATITADHFIAGQKVDVTGYTQGKGFAGAMKRWNFGGLRATHGVSLSHRSRGLLFVKGSVPGAKNSWMLVADAVKFPMPEDAPFPGAMRRNADEIEHVEADAGLVESAAEHEVHTDVTPEQQEKLMQQQDAGADAEGTDEGKES